jgi:hypothetical protein
MATTTNFGWETPDDTDLVKDGAAAIRTALGGVDTSFVDLKGGTTGQVLSKASNTDLDYTWVTSDDANAIQNAIVDAKGDLIAATANDTPARLAVGADNAFLQADSTAATGIKWNNDAWTTYTPVVTSQVGTIPTYTASGRWIRIGKTVFVTAKVNITTVVGAAGYIAISLPVNAANTTTGNGSGVENTAVGYQTLFSIGGSVSSAWAWKYDFSSLAIAGHGFQFAMAYEGA